MDFDGPWHGKEGRIPVRRIFPDLWPEHAKAVGEGVQGRPAGNSSSTRTRNGRTGISRSPSPTPMSGGCRRRSATSIPARGMRENLTISTDTAGQRRCSSTGMRCVGVKARGRRARDQEFRGSEIILSCGAIHSPAHLMRAGIGPAAHLREHGHRGAGGAAGRRAAAAGSSGGGGGGVPQAARADHPRLHAAAYLHWRCAIPRTCRAFRRATCSRW